ncbi:cora-like Mg2+ transporter protein-domain-containing protein [Lophiotrema nucula]|uniref:Cora-like Mg2+ transporter protein-domain-containing protein n=1 Tax=Lophiotrema nucula TaxID=690887 RepID=A0A6A5YLY3_9PLEO|nr:cora-like Mg2+ transporter protein-domain-containing protein [Lophiotrema nucula]
MFKSFLDHDWHLDPLFNRQSGVLPPHPFLYILSSSLWETNFRWLDAKIKRISFRDLRDPKDTTNDDLHDCREDLVYIQHHIAECINWTDPSLVTFLEEMEPRNKYELGTIRNPISNLRRVLDDSEKLQAFLSDTFQLLMSSISVRDSRISAEEAVKSSRQAILNAYQARQSAWLTQLATMYLPLSVLTGIFGMNIKELNDAHASFWWPIVVLVILMGCTGIAYSILKLKDGWRPTGLRFRKQKGSLPNITP